MYFQLFAGQRVIAVYRQFAVLDLGDKEALDLAGFVLHLHFRTQLAELGRYILDIVGECQIRIVFAKSTLRGDGDTHLITRLLADNRLVHSTDQLSLAAMDIVDRQIALLQDVALDIADGIGQRDKLAVFNAFLSYNFV